MAQQLQHAKLGGNGTSPAIPFYAAQTTPATEGSFWSFLMPFSQTLNISDSDPLTVGLFKSLYYGLGISEGLTFNISVSDVIMGTSPAHRQPSLLSGVPFLNNMTRHSYINQLIVTIAEGYVITILVVVSFILVFLIREWVVQQQPGINMGAGFNAEFAAPERPGEREQAVPVERLPGNIPEPREVGQRPMAQHRRRGVQFDGAEDGEPHPALQEDTRSTHETGEGPSHNRPAPVRDALTPAAEIQKQLTEEPRMTEEFLAIWYRADSDPKEVVRIIEQENKGDEMRYWVNAMNILQTPLRQDNRLQPHNHSSKFSRTIDGAGPSTLDSTGPISVDSEGGGVENAMAQQGSSQSSASSENWVDVSKPTSSFQDEDISTKRDENSILPRPQDSYNFSSDKGKGKERDQSQELSAEQSSGANRSNWDQPAQNPWNAAMSPSQSHGLGNSISRPRAISDGPQLKNISPLANNNWTFKNLHDTDAGNAGPSSPGLNETENNVQDVQSQTSSAVSGFNTSLPEQPYQETEAWKAAQDLRVQQAIEKGREAHRSQEHYPTPDESPDPALYGPIQIQGQDGIVRTHQNWDEVFENNPIPDSDDESEGNNTAPEPNPFQPDTPLPEVREPLVVRPAEPEGFFGNVADWLWGGADDRRRDEGGNDEHIVEDLAAEAPFVPVAHHDVFDQGEFAEQDREVVEAAIAAGIDPNDPDAIDDAEDFEGIMELIGMRGPIFSLVQNALFSAFLLALTVAFGVWIPYNIGRVSLLLVANPGPALKLPLRIIFWCAAFLQDLAATILGVVSYCLFTLFSVPVNFWHATSSGPAMTGEGLTWRAAALQLSNDAVERILEGTVNSLLNFKDSDIFTFSAASHEALLTLESLATAALEAIGHTVIFLFVGDYTLSLIGTWSFFVGLLQGAWHLVSSLLSFFARPDSWVISLEVAKRATPLNPELSVWNGVDRFWATVAGYATLSILGALYVKKGSPFSNGPIGREWEATIIDLLHQAGGVMKVILIISIEMLVFPLYCGLLLDAALLPLFENATIMSRILFTFTSPLTSIFVHWFVGTCYMFHFALFVSMCRKIMRKGVLCKFIPPSYEYTLILPDFIRDPDDPTFHPVRDVLERNVATQLRKILFSALVYGALVVICLGGVVWGLSFTFSGVLPIHWSSNEPVLEFPVDLLFYNFLMPLAVKFFKPSDGLHAMYSWWFRRCARMLRLTWFMFDERQLDEEGYTVRRSWKDVFRRVKADPLKMVKTEDPRQPFLDNPELNAYFRQDGRYVRAPASDQVRIPKGTQIFLQVDELNNRIDGQWDRPDGVHGRNSELYKQVYIPPYFRLRICAFILSLWIFAALTGVSITIVPLVFGRLIFSKMIPSDIRQNDVYAFSIGIYILGSALYGIMHLRHFATYLISSLSLNHETPHNVLRRLSAIISRVARIVWTYTAFIFILPILFAFLIEFYAILPLHTYFSPHEQHTIHFVQSWTLGLLYLKLTSRIILLYSESRPAISLRAITRDGCLNPDAKLATRSFILPGSLAIGTALVWPWCIARIALLTVFRGAGDEQKVLVYRYAYPAVLVMAFWCWLGWLMAGVVKVWRSRIRDEVYLIGERLHNFGERKAGASGSSGVGIPVRRIET
jgi:E3 ubiquitin-protein ligase MARCH6